MQNDADPDRPASENETADILGGIRNAARQVNVEERRERLTTSILHMLQLLNPFDGEDVAEDELDGDALVVARYVTTLAAALDHYIDTGDVIIGVDPLGHLRST